MKRFLLTFICLIFLSPAAFGQNPTTARGIELFKAGDFRGAISVLQAVLKNNKKDGEAFYVLGAAQLQLKELKNARKSLQKAAKLLPQDGRVQNALAQVEFFRGKAKEAKKYAERAVALAPDNANAHYFLGVVRFNAGATKGARESADTAIRLNPNLAEPYLLKTEAIIYDEGQTDSSQAERAERFESVTQILESYPNLQGATTAIGELRERLEIYRQFAAYFKKRAEPAEIISPATPAAPSSPDPSVTPLRILSTPRAIYTEEARKNNVTGTVRVLVLFSRDGVTVYPVVLKGLKHGLTEQALKAARRIRFEPQKRNGEPISIVKTVEFGFNLY